MAQLTVRNVDPSLVEALKARAKAAGRSMEAEHRRLLEAALQGDAGNAFLAHAAAGRLRLREPVDLVALIRADRDRDSLR